MSGVSGSPCVRACLVGRAQSSLFFLSLSAPYALASSGSYGLYGPIRPGRPQMAWIAVEYQRWTPSSIWSGRRCAATSGCKDGLDTTILRRWQLRLFLLRPDGLNSDCDVSTASASGLVAAEQLGWTARWLAAVMVAWTATTLQNPVSLRSGSTPFSFLSLEISLDTYSARIGCHRRSGWTVCDCGHGNVACVG